MALLYALKITFFLICFLLRIVDINNVLKKLFVWFAWLASKYKNSFSFLSRFALLILDLSSEAATGGVLYKKTVFRNIAIFTVIAIFNLLLN